MPRSAAARPIGSLVSIILCNIKLLGRRPAFEQICVFQPPTGATYDDHLQRVVNFLLALIELFSLGVTAEALRAIIGSKSAILLPRGLVDPKFQVQGVAPHQ